MDLTKKQWGDKFETFLIDKHASQYHGLDDDMPDDYNDWLQDLDHDEIIEFVGEFMLSRTSPKMLKPLDEEAVRKFLWSFFQPDLTGNEKKIERLTREFCTQFSRPELCVRMPSKKADGYQEALDIKVGITNIATKWSKDKISGFNEAHDLFTQAIQKAGGKVE